MILKECQYCHELVPDFVLSEEARAAVFERIENATRTHCVLEVCYWAKCNSEEAGVYLDHLRECLFSWPYEKDEMEVLKAIDSAFLGVEKPTQSGNFWHCDECQECEELLQSVDVFSIKRRMLCFGFVASYISHKDAIRYWMPAMARCGLEIKHQEARGTGFSALSWIESHHKFAGLSSVQVSAVTRYLEFANRLG